MKLLEVKLTSERAGFIPYFKDEDGEIQFFFMIPSDPGFGGAKPQIAKGGVEDGEIVLEAALREAKEELGLKRSNLKSETIKLVWRGKVRGSEETYSLTVYMGEVKSKNKFNEACYESESCKWLTAKEFASQGRKNQVHIVRAASRLLE